jgi:hypothetical protein
MSVLRSSLRAGSFPMRRHSSRLDMQRMVGRKRDAVFRVSSERRGASPRNVLHLFFPLDRHADSTSPLKSELSHGCATYHNRRRRVNRCGDGSRSCPTGITRHRHRARGSGFSTTGRDHCLLQRFLEGCAACHIPARDIPVQRALAIEPFLNPKVLAAVQVHDGVFEPFRFCPAFLATARLNGAVVRRYTEVTDFVCQGKCVAGVKVTNRQTGERETI